MERKFDFDRIGKRMPYKAPEGFLDELEASIWKEVQKESAQTPKRKTHHWRIYAGVLAVAASITILFVFSPIFHKEQTCSFSAVEQAFSRLSQEDQAYILTVYQEDIFLNE